MIKIGTCGWGYFSPGNFIKDWKEKFSSRLAAYASLFDLVEVDSTFYKLPKPATAEKWYEEAKEVNSNFEFIPKAPKEITHASFAAPSSIVASFLDVAEKMRARLLLFQTPQSFGYSIENEKRVKDFFAGLRRQAKQTFLWEPRGTLLKEGKALKALSRLAIIVTDPLREILPFEQSMYYFRLHGFGKHMMYAYKFSDKELKSLAKILAEERFSKKEVYLMFNNVYMFEDALRFKSLLK